MNTSFSHTIFFTSFFMILFCCSKSPEPITIRIGTQEWTNKNLDVVTFRNGDSIIETRSAEAWREANEKGQAAWCYYENDPKNGEKYGKLYNWYAVNDTRGLAPQGYHVPSAEEWESLVSYLGGKEKAGKKLKSIEGWSKDGNYNNESDFSGLAGGYSDYDGRFNGIGNDAYWWSVTEGILDGVFYWNLDYNYDGVNRYFGSKGFGFSVRCLRD
jgi:uncharacterized protein (TIGR02145 family)